MKSRGERLEHRAVVDERSQGALLHRPFRPTEVRRFGEGLYTRERCRYGAQGEGIKWMDMDMGNKITMHASYFIFVAR